MYMLKFQWEEKQDKKYIHKTYNRSGLLHNTAGSLLGKSRTVENEKLDVSVDHLEVEWDSVRSTMDLADEVTNSSTGGKMPFPLQKQILPGAFFFLNKYFPALAMHPFVKVQYNLPKPGRFLIAKEAHAEVQGTKMSADDFRYRIDHTKTRLIVPYLRLPEKDFKKTENAYFDQPPTDYETDHMVMVEASRTFNTTNDPTSVSIRVPEMTKLQNNMPDQFGIAFVLDDDLRGDGNLGREKIPFSRSGIVKIQITSVDSPSLRKDRWIGAITRL